MVCPTAAACMQGSPRMMMGKTFPKKIMQTTQHERGGRGRLTSNDRGAKKIPPDHKINPRCQFIILTFHNTISVLYVFYVADFIRASQEFIR